MFTTEHACLGFTEGHRRVIAALCLAENEPEQSTYQKDRNYVVGHR